MNNRAIKIAAGVGALSIFALALGAGQGFATPVVSGAQSAAVASLPKATTANPNQLSVTVGKALTIAADADGTPTSKGFAVQTNVSGTGTSTVNIPVGPNRPVDVNSFKPLNVSDNSVVYNLNNTDSQVQNLLLTAGQYNQELPVTIETIVKVDGKQVDANAATSLTGQVDIQWVFTNNTTTKEQISYLDAFGKQVTESADVSIPFSISLEGTYGDGWTNIVAPWANSGFSSGQIVTGSGALSGASTTMTVSGLADKADLPSMIATLVPHDSSGEVTSGIGKVAQIGTEVEGILAGEAVPLLVSAQAGLGKAAGDIATMLDSKVNPVLDLLSRLRLDPAGIDKLLDTVGTDLAQGGDMLLGINAAIDGGVAELAGALADLMSPKNQQALDKLVDQLEDLDGILNKVIPALGEVAKALPEAQAALGEPVPAAVAGFVCPPSTPNCTVGQALESVLLSQLPTTCSSGANTNTVYAANQTALSDAIASGKITGSELTNLQQLQTLLNAQLAGAGSWDPTACQTGSQTVANGLEGLLGNLSTIGNDLGELVPLLQTLDEGLGEAAAALSKMNSNMPAIRNALDRPCSPANLSNISNCGLMQALTITSNADVQASKQLDEGVLALVNTLKAPINELFAVANDLGRAAKPLKKEIDDIPSLLTTLANGPVGYFAGAAQNLSEMAASLTDGASKMAAVNKAIDKKFAAGQAFPYGSATGTGAVTSATYAFTMSAATTASASTGVIMGFAILLLLIGLGSSVWLTRRS